MSMTQAEKDARRNLKRDAEHLALSAADGRAEYSLDLSREIIDIGKMNKHPNLDEKYARHLVQQINRGSSNA